jgi:CRP-like cAMP-binding protein
MNNEQFPFFNNFQKNIIRILKKNAYQKTYQKGHVVHHEGDVCTGLEYIVSGSVVISHISFDGSLYNINTLHKNAFISPNNVYATDSTYFIYIEVVEKTEILHIPRKSIDVALEYQSFRQFFLRLISDTGKKMGSKLVYERRMSLRSKITTYLRHISTIQKSSTITLPISKTILANNLGVARTSLSRELHKMKQEGLIEFSHKTFILLNI